MGAHWNEADVLPEAKERVTAITERLKTIGFDVIKIDENVADDDVPKQLLKSFIDFKDRNPLKGLNTYQACYAVYARHS
jgi:CRISPR-associated endonuclease Csn1